MTKHYTIDDASGLLDLVLSDVEPNDFEKNSEWPTTTKATFDAAQQQSFLDQLLAITTTELYIG